MNIITGEVESVVVEVNAGPPGPQGPQGIQGAQGVQGPIGPIGPQGVQGLQGVKGDQGDVGPQGPQGPQGATGATGAQGDVGPQGPAGTGIQLKGEVATVGDLPSTLNVIGDSYIVTADGNLWVWSGSAWGDAGQIVGPQGPQGVAGAQGPQGEVGPIGPTGPQGAQGVQGPQGVQGLQGPAGVDGATGATGAQGPQGPQGATGATGPQGPAGADGVGIPAGGTAGQILRKVNSTDYNTTWASESNDSIIVQAVSNLPGSPGFAYYFYADGVLGANLEAVPIDPIADNTRTRVLGVATEPISGDGTTLHNFIRTGVIEGVDTTGFSVSDPLYVTAVGDGSYTNVLPIGSVAIQIGFVMTVGVNGKIYVNVESYHFLNSLADVEIAANTLADGQALVYNSINGTWANGTVSGLPSQTGQSGKYLTTNGTTASWATVAGGGGGEPALSTYRSGVDGNGIYTILTYKRQDGTNYKVSTLSGGTSPTYTTRTVQNYAADGTTVTSTEVYTLSYSGINLTQEVLN